METHTAQQRRAYFARALLQQRQIELDYKNIRNYIIVIMSEEDAVKCTPENIEQFLSQSGSMRSRALQSNGIVPAVNAATVMLAMKTKCNLLS